jgi:hypothetical protein
VTAVIAAYKKFCAANRDSIDNTVQGTSYNLTSNAVQGTSYNLSAMGTALPPARPY